MKTLRPVRKRKLVDEIRGKCDLSIAEPVVFCWSLSPLIITRHVETDRPTSSNGSRKVARGESVMAIGVFMCCFVVKAGRSARRRRDAFIANWAFMTKRRAGRSRRSCLMTAASLLSRRLEL